MPGKNSYHVRCKDNAEAQTIMDALKAKVAESRFTVDYMEIVTTTKTVRLYLINIRLRKSKDYCGNHAGPCRVGGGRHRNAKYLEGSDWVSFNDMVNDVLDALNHDGSAQSWLNFRKEGKRRTYYDGQSGGEFYKEGEHNDYEDYRGRQAPPSELMNGTPGIIGWRQDAA